MSQKSREVVIFDGNGKELVEGPPTTPLQNLPGKNNFKKDPGAMELIEVFVVEKGEVKFEWHEPLKTRHFAVIIIILAIATSLFVVRGYHDKKKSQETFEAAMADRKARGCKQIYPWLSPDEGDKDEGCRPKGQAP